MSPIWGRYGPFFLYGYTVVLGLGVLAALGITAVMARRRDADRWGDALMVAALGALAGGRMAFVLLNAPYFVENPAEAWQLWLGGLNYHGALLGGSMALWLWASRTGRSFHRYAGLMAPGLALLVAFGWGACWIDGCGYGRTAAPGLLTADLPDDLGVYAVRYRIQAAGALGALAVFVLVGWASGRARPALVFWIVIGGLAVVHLVVGLGRGDVMLITGRRLDVWAEGLILVVAVIACAAVLLRSRSTRPAGRDQMME